MQTGNSASQAKPSAGASQHNQAPSAPRGEGYHLRILRSLRRIIRAVDVHSRRLAQEHGVTVPQLLCMLKIDELGPMTQKELSDAVFLNPSTIVGIIDRLEKSGVFVRERSEEDRRRVRISLTSQGKRMVKQSPSPLQKSLVEGIDSLPELERATIALALERIIELIDSGSINPELQESAEDPILETTSEIDGEEEPLSPRVG